MGSAEEIERAINTMHARSPEALRELLLSDTWLKAFLTAFKKRLDDHQRDAVRLYAQAIELVGGREDRTLVILLSTLGVQDIEQARQMIERVKSLEAVDEHATYRMCERFVREYRQRNQLPMLIEDRGAIGSSAEVVEE